MGSAFLKEPIRDKTTHKYQHRKIRVITTEMQGWRKNMEDAIVFHRISKEIFLFAIFDGHSGGEVATFCGRHIAEYVQKTNQFKQGRYEQALKTAFYNLDKQMDTQQGEAEIKKIGKQLGLQQFEGSSKVADSVGCTANVVLMVGNTIYCANTGDSRSGLSRKGEVIELSKDHKPQDETELNRINKAGYTVTKGRINQHLNLSRCLGDLHYKRKDSLSYEEQAVTYLPDITKNELTTDDDFLIMGCDGVWERYENDSQGLIDRIREERMKGNKPEEVMEKLLDSFLSPDPAKEQLGCDNMSAILIEFNKLAI